MQERNNHCDSLYDKLEAGENREETFKSNVETGKSIVRSSTASAVKPSSFCPLDCLLLHEICCGLVGSSAFTPEPNTTLFTLNFLYGLVSGFAPTNTTLFGSSRLHVPFQWSWSRTFCNQTCASCCVNVRLSQCDPMVNMWRRISQYRAMSYQIHVLVPILALTVTVHVLIKKCTYMNIVCMFGVCAAMINARVYQESFS